MTIWIHVGSRKAGSSSLQQWLATNRPALAELNYVYPTTPHCRGQSAKAHHNLPRQIRERGKFDPRLVTWEGVRAEHESQPQQQVIVSCENLLDFPADGIQRIRELLKGIDVRIVAYLRRQSSYIQSEYGQHAKYQGMSVPILKFSEQRATFMQYSTHLNRWADVFGDANVKVRRLERSAMVNGDLIDDFCSVVGLPQPSAHSGYLPAEDSNPLPDRQTLAVIDALHKHFSANRRKGRDVREQAHQISALVLRTAKTIWPQTDRPVFLSSAQCRKLDRRYEEDCERIRVRFLPTLEGPLFAAADPDTAANLGDPGEVLEAIPVRQMVELFGETIVRIWTEGLADTRSGDDEPDTKRNRRGRTPAKLKAAKTARPDKKRKGRTGPRKARERKLGPQQDGLLI